MCTTKPIFVLSRTNSACLLAENVSQNLASLSLLHQTWPKCFHLMTSSWIWRLHTYISMDISSHGDTMHQNTVYPKKYAHGFVVLCFIVVMQSFIMNSHAVFIHIHQGCFAGFGAIVRLPQCQWSKPDGYAKISQCITTTKHSKAVTVCIFLGIYCIVIDYPRKLVPMPNDRMETPILVTGKLNHRPSLRFAGSIFVYMIYEQLIKTIRFKCSTQQTHPDVCECSKQAFN